MMASRGAASRVLIAGAAGTLFLVPAHGSGQDSLSVACADLSSISPLEDLTRCAQQGQVSAQFNLAVKYWAGIGIPADDIEAVRWYRSAAEQGLALAQVSLGFMYATGDGVPEDDAEAARWYRLAAEQGIASAQLDLGRMYDNGTGVPEDDAEAARWYRLAAEQGGASAQVSLGLMYFTGEGVPQDLVLAYMWCNLSAAQGNDVARESKDGIEEQMTREEIAEAQRLSREWIEEHPQDGGN